MINSCKNFLRSLDIFVTELNLNLEEGSNSWGQQSLNDIIAHKRMNQLNTALQKIPSSREKDKQTPSMDVQKEGGDADTIEEENQEEQHFHKGSVCGGILFVMGALLMVEQLAQIIVEVAIDK